MSVTSNNREIVDDSSSETLTELIQPIIKLRSNGKGMLPVWPMLLIGDVLAASLTLLATNHFYPAGEWVFAHSSAEALFYVIGLVSVFYLFGLYDYTNLAGGDGEYSRLFSSVNFFVLLTLLWQSFKVGGMLPTKEIVGVWIIQFSSFSAVRFLMRRIGFFLRTLPAFHGRTLILGAGVEGIALARQWTDVKSSGLDVIGYLDDKLPVGISVERGIKVVGKTSQVAEMIREYNVDSLLVSDTELFRQLLDSDDHLVEALQNVQIQLSTGISDYLNTGIRVLELGYVPVMILQKRRVNGLQFIAKSILDFVAALIVLTLLLPLFLIVAILIKLESSGPVLHSRKCVGAGGRSFAMLKFRSMRMDGDSILSEGQLLELQDKQKLTEDPRLTRVGRFIRKLSIDELPQLLNVLRGEMSLVGPRPVIEAELEKFGKVRHNRTAVKPGMTGLWQVSGRSDLSYDERVLLDSYYIRNYTIWLDLKILFQTIPATLMRRGAY